MEGTSQVEVNRWGFSFGPQWNRVLKWRSMEWDSQVEVNGGGFSCGGQ